MQENLIETLRNIGFTEGEAKVFVALTRLGTSTVGPILNTSSVSTSKVYVILDKLINKGIVEKGIKRYTAAEPNSLLDFLKNEQERISKDMEKVRDIIPQLQGLEGSKSKKPSMEMLKGKRGFRNAVEEMIEEAEENEAFNCLVGKRVSFEMQSLWKPLSEITDKKKISQISTYEYSTWYEKDPKIHQRKKRKLLFPKVLDKKHSEMPYILVLGNETLIADIEGNQVVSFVIRNKMLSEAFVKLLNTIRENGKLPEGYKISN